MYSDIIDTWSSHFFHQNINDKNKLENNDFKHLYIMSNSNTPGCYKVGRASDPIKRLKDANSEFTFNNPYNLEYCSSMKIPKSSGAERAMHRAYDHYRIDPNKEWFNFDINHGMECIVYCVEQIGQR